MCADVITDEDKRLIVGHNKVKKAQEKSLDQEFDYFCQKGETGCIFLDGLEGTAKAMLKAGLFLQRCATEMDETSLLPLSSSFLPSFVLQLPEIHTNSCDNISQFSVDSITSQESKEPVFIAAGDIR